MSRGWLEGHRRWSALPTLGTQVGYLFKQVFEYGHQRVKGNFRKAWHLNGCSWNPGTVHFRPPIISRTVALRCFVLEDAPKIFAMSQEAGVRTWLPDQVYESEARAIEVLRHLIEQCRDPGTPCLAPYVLGVFIHGSRELIGHVGLSPLGGEIEIGYAIEEGRQRKGFATEAVRVMSEWALARFALPRVLAIVAAENAASCKVLQNAGFQLAEESIRSLHGRSGLVRTYQKTGCTRIR